MPLCQSPLKHAKTRHLCGMPHLVLGKHYSFWVYFNSQYGKLIFNAVKNDPVNSVDPGVVRFATIPRNFF